MFDNRRVFKKCRICSLFGRFHTHHSSYENLGHETIDDVVNLCPICHKAVHNRYAISHKKFGAAHVILAKEWNKHAQKNNLYYLRGADRKTYKIKLAQFFEVDMEDEFVRKYIVGF